MSKRTNFVFRPGVIQLENREVPSVASVNLAGGILSVACNNASSTVVVSGSPSGVVVHDVSVNAFWSFGPGQVSRVDLFGGSGNDKFTAGGIRTRMFGNAGNDIFHGGALRDVMVGGGGNDRMFGNGGNDSLNGGTGNDYLDGGNGADILLGGAGDDYLNGGAGADALTGDVGNDTLIAIDSTTTDTVDGGGGVDVIWIDQNGATTDLQTGVDISDVVRAVASFANSADRTLNGDNIADPALLTGTGIRDRYETILSRPLFSAAGPVIDDIDQGRRNTFGGGGFGNLALGDGWLLAGLGAIVDHDANLIRSNVVDFGDGTFGVKLGSSFYRVDNQMPVQQYGSVLPAYAGLGPNGTLWVPVVEKAFAYFLTGANSYASLDGTGGASAAAFTTTVFTAFDATSTTTKPFNGAGGFATATALGDAIKAAVDGNKLATVTIQLAPALNALNSNQAYAILSYATNLAGVVTSVTVQDPEGGTITTTPTNLFALTGTFDTGTI